MVGMSQKMSVEKFEFLMELMLVLQKPQMFSMQMVLKLEIQMVPMLVMMMVVGLVFVLALWLWTSLEH